MAGDWIKMRTNLWDDPRVVAVCDRLDITEATAVGAFYRLWSIADEHSEDGTLPALTPAGVDRKVGVKGFAEAVASVGWLTISDGHVAIERFGEHNGKSAKRRSSEARRKASARDADRLRADFGHDADEKRTPCGARPRPSTKPSPKDEPNGSLASQTESATTRKLTFSEWDRQFAERMHADILLVVPSAKAPSFDAWANDLRLMREADKRSEADIESLWSWANRDDFWRSVLLSPRKLREKWTQLAAKRAATQRGSPGRQAPDKFAGNREFLERLKHESGEIQSTDGAAYGDGRQGFLG